MILDLDLYSVLVMTAVVVNVSGVLFIVETLLRRDEGAGRIWALAFLAAMLTTLAYVIWVQSPEAWWAIAVGNAAFVAGTGCMWLGCRRFNGRRMGWSSVVVAAAVAGGGDRGLRRRVRTGATGRGRCGCSSRCSASPAPARSSACAASCANRARRGCSAPCSLFQSLYYLSRTTAFLTSGPDSALFQNAFGTIPTSFVTVTLTIVAVVVTSVLRASRAPMRGHLRPAGYGTARDGILSQDVFDGAMSDLCERAQWRSELVGVIAVRIDDLEQISTAFGSEVARAVTETWRTGVRRHAPSNAFVAEDGPTGLLVGVLVESPREARRQAAVIYRGLFDDLGMVGERRRAAASWRGHPGRGGRRGAERHDRLRRRALAAVAREAATRAAIERRRRPVLIGEAE